MANTLKFGNGLWATQENSVLAYNDENGNYKPLPFEFERDTNATVVNKNGLIETVGNNIPRIDFQGNNKGALLLEPERTNLLPYSQEISNPSWGFGSISAVNDNPIVSPDGTQNASRVIDNVANSVHRITESVTTVASGDVTFSVFLKKGTLTTAYIQMFTLGTVAPNTVDLENGTISGGGTIEDYGNDWYRCSITAPSTSTTTTVYVYLKQSSNYVGGSGSLYVWGAQLEQGSYPTSYIPTSGGAVTRGVDNATNNSTKVLSLSNQASFYWYVKGQTGANDLNNSNYVMRYNLDDSTDGFSYVALNTTAFEWRIRIQSGTMSNFQSTNVDKSEDVKIVVTVNTSTFSLYANGVLIINQPYSGDAITFENIRINFDLNNENKGVFSLIDTKAYNTELTNTEAIALTTI